MFCRRGKGFCGLGKTLFSDSPCNALYMTLGALGQEFAIRMADIRDVTDGIRKLRKSYN